VPELAHWYSLKPADLDDLTDAEASELLKRMRTFPPIGAVFLVERKK
jgi:hypothetical protein